MDFGGGQRALNLNFITKTGSRFNAGLKALFLPSMISLQTSLAYNS